MPFLLPLVPYIVVAGTIASIASTAVSMANASKMARQTTRNNKILAQRKSAGAEAGKTKFSLSQARKARVRNAEMIASSTGLGGATPDVLKTNNFSNAMHLARDKNWNTAEEATMFAYEMDLQNVAIETKKNAMMIQGASTIVSSAFSGVSKFGVSQDWWSADELEKATGTV